MRIGTTVEDGLPVDLDTFQGETWVYMAVPDLCKIQVRDITAGLRSFLLHYTTLSQEYYDWKLYLLLMFLVDLL